MARRSAGGRGQSGGGGPHRTGTPARDPEAAVTGREARTAPVDAGPVTHLRVQPLRRASAGRARKAEDPARRGSGARVYPVASGPPVPASVAESVSGLAPAADRVCARRSVVLSSHVTASTDTLRGPGNQGVPAEKSVRVATVDVAVDDRIRFCMPVLLSLLFRTWARTRAALQLEILALRHQLQVLQRSRPPRLRIAKTPSCGISREAPAACGDWTDARR